MVENKSLEARIIELQNLLDAYKQTIDAGQEIICELKEENRRLKQALKEEEKNHKSNLQSKDFYINNQAEYMRKYQVAIDILKNKFSFSKHGQTIYIDFCKHELLHCLGGICCIKRYLSEEENKIIDELFMFKNVYTDRKEYEEHVKQVILKGQQNEQM